MLARNILQALVFHRLMIPIVFFVLISNYSLVAARLAGGVSLVGREYCSQLSAIIITISNHCY